MNLMNSVAATYTELVVCHSSLQSLRSEVASIFLLQLIHAANVYEISTSRRKIHMPEDFPLVQIPMHF